MFRVDYNPLILTFDPNFPGNPSSYNWGDISPHKNLLIFGHLQGPHVTPFINGDGARLGTVGAVSSLG